MNPYGGLANRWFQPLTHVSASVMRSRGALAFKDWAYSGVYRPYQLRLGPSVASMMIFYGTPLKSRDKRVFHALHVRRSEEHTSELQSLMRISYAVFCLKKNKKRVKNTHYN